MVLISVAECPACMCVYLHLICMHVLSYCHSYVETHYISNQHPIRTKDYGRDQRFCVFIFVCICVYVCTHVSIKRLLGTHPWLLMGTLLNVHHYYNALYSTAIIRILKVCWWGGIKVPLRKCNQVEPNIRSKPTVYQQWLTLNLWPHWN